MTTTDDTTTATAPRVLDDAWIEETRHAVADGFDCGVCLDFGYLDGLGPCPHCDPDGYAEHVYYALRERRSGLGGSDPWERTRASSTGRDIVWSRS